MTLELWLDVLSYTRLLSYGMGAILFGLVIPVYHRSFRLTMRALGLFWLAGGITLYMRIFSTPAANLWWSNWCLTPATFGVILAAMYNLRLVAVWRHQRKTGG